MQYNLAVVALTPRRPALRSLLTEAITIADKYRAAVDRDPTTAHYKEQAAFREALWRSGSGGARDTALSPEWQCRGGVGCLSLAGVTVHSVQPNSAGAAGFFHPCRIIHSHGLV